MDSPTSIRTPSAPAGNTIVLRHLLHKGGPSLINLRLDTNEIHVVVTGPGMLFERLRLMTSLSIFDGYSIHQLRTLASTLEGHVFCGGTGIQRVSIEVNYHRTGGALEIGVGPPSMYQNEIVLRTTTGETFAALIDRLLNSGRGGVYLAALHGVAARDHLEHSHGTPDTVDDVHARHGDHEMAEGVIAQAQITKTETQSTAAAEVAPKPRRRVKKPKRKKTVTAKKKKRTSSKKRMVKKTGRGVKKAPAKGAKSARKRPSTRKSSNRARSTVSRKRVKKGGRHGRS